MAIIKQYHADTDTTYVYSSEYYWDPEKKQSRSKRRVIGKIDPETGEVVPTGGKRGRPRKASPEAEPSDPPVRAGSAGSTKEHNREDSQVQELKLSLAQKEEQIRVLERQNSRYASQLSKIRRQLKACLDSMDNTEETAR